ncbi:MAG: NYN domain-containing protein [Candidatus Magasanikbacteria bacterium]|nr:NYN domain-containing protein [Candidatus Magasanikbacteria bacterium]
MMMKPNLNKKSNPLKHPDQRVGVFIDVQNMYYSAKNLFSAKVNFGNILIEGVAGRKLIRAIAYVVRTETKEEQPFFDALNSLGIETKHRPLQIFWGGEKKADWDVGLTVDAIRLSNSLDAIVLVSGDGDFLPLIEYLKYNQGKQVEVMAFGETSSGKLREVADNFTDLSADKAKFLIQDRRYPRSVKQR